jgi:hypothetical protein
MLKLSQDSHRPSLTFSIQKVYKIQLTYVSTSIFMLKSYTRHVRSQIFPRIDVQKSWSYWWKIWIFSCLVQIVKYNKVTCSNCPRTVTDPVWHFPYKRFTKYTEMSCYNLNVIIVKYFEKLYCDIVKILNPSNFVFNIICHSTTKKTFNQPFLITVKSLGNIWLLTCLV